MSSDSSAQEHNNADSTRREVGSSSNAPNELSTPQPMPDAATTTVQPEAQDETNGGPLGCCLGVIVGLLLSLSIAIVSRFYADPLAHIFSSSLSTIVRVTMILFAVAAVIACGYFGWRIGKKAYREYDPPVVKDRRRRLKAAAKSKRT